MNCRVIRSHHPRHAPPGAIVTVRVLGRSGVFFLIAVTAGDPPVQPQAPLSDNCSPAVLPSTRHGRIHASLPTSRVGH